VIYGGAFDPVHTAHLALAEFALQELGAAELRFLPAGRSPWKEGHEATFAERLAMLERATAGSPFVIDDREGRRPGPSYTIDTLRELRAERDTPLLLLMGSDTLAGFPGWRDPEGILQLADLVVINRPGSLSDSPVPHRVLQWPGMELSSSWLRQRIADGADCRYLLPEGVWSYIRERGLYGCRAAQPMEHGCLS
jgi:nicotinate-nucleotide adenylyltransferase